MRKRKISEQLHFGTDDPNKKYTCQEGLLTVNWAQNPNQSQQFINCCFVFLNTGSFYIFS